MIYRVIFIIAVLWTLNLAECEICDSCLPICCNATVHNCESRPSSEHGFMGFVESENGTEEEDLSKRFELVYATLKCEKYVVSRSEENFSLDQNGLLLYEGSHNKDRFCLRSTDDILVCFEKGAEETPLKYRLYPFGLLLSVPCLVVTSLVYGLIPELRNLHGKNLICYVSCLAVAYTTMALIHLEIVTTGLLCTTVGYVAYMAFVSSFFWMNVLCFDIWRTFRGVSGLSGKSSQRKKFVLYSIYSWGCTILIVVWAFVADHTDITPEKYRPMIGETNCFVKYESSFLYMYMVMILQLLFNATLFICTAYQIRKLQRETARQIKGESRTFNRMEADKDRFPLVRFGLYLRLFIVMGVTWIAEVLSFLIEAKDEYSYFTDFLNCLHGFFIFFLFVWKPKIKALIIKRYRVVRGLETPSSYGFRSSTQTNTSNVYSRQNTMNNSHQLKSINNGQAPEKLLDNGEGRD